MKDKKYTIPLFSSVLIRILHRYFLIIKIFISSKKSKINDKMNETNKH